jgi:hypothetical protein
MELIVQEIVGRHYDEPIQDNETINDFLDIDAVVKVASSIAYYLRYKQDCPYGRGNWILDIYCKNDEIVMLKFPKDMTEERFALFLKPLIDRFRH